MIKLKYTSYGKMPLNVYFKLLDILNSDYDDMEKELHIIALLADISYDELLDVNMSELTGISEKLSFLNEFKVEGKRKIKHLTINNVKYDVCTDLKDFNVSQYVDFQTYTSDNNPKQIATILSAFVIPHGKKYGEGYDVLEVINDFNEYLDLETAISIQNFFIKKLGNYIINILRYLRAQMKLMKTTKMNKSQLAQVEKQIAELQRMYGSVLSI